MLNRENCFFGAFMWMNNENRAFIPLWFLRNHGTRCTRRWYVVLPYHYGSHATFRRNLKRKWKVCFHTTMVLTQPEPPDPETLSEDSFHTTMVLTQHAGEQIRRRFNMNVSIPLWFSRNAGWRHRLAWGQRCFHTTMVLTQRVRFTNFAGTYASCFHTTMVLTQRYQFYLSAPRIPPFPYHYGSHATQLLGESGGNLPEGFHTTMVLTQREQEKKEPGKVTWFPYHYGSYATHRKKARWFSVSQVSIPLWFLRNAK